MKLAWQGLSLVAGAALLPLGGGPSLRVSSTQLASAYVRVTSSSAMLVQWTDVDSRLSGTFDSAVLSSNESRVVAKVCSVNGSESGPSLVVTISCPGVAGSVRFSGSVTRSGIVLYMPQPSGTIEAAAFAPGSVASYDTAVRRLQAQTEIPSLKAYVSSHNVRPDPVLFGQSITVRTAPFSTRGQILAIVGYNTSPKVVPVLATLRWGGRRGHRCGSPPSLGAGLGFPTGSRHSRSSGAWSHTG